VPDEFWVLVAGPGDATPPEVAAAETAGRSLALAGVVVLGGGGDGVMAASCRGAASVGGRTVALLPGDDRRAANRWIGVAVATGLGEGRNALLVRNADAVIAIGGGHGTLSEIALALRAGTLVVGLGTWAVDGVVLADGPQDAVERVVAALAPS
jgi:hypothetical protein